MKPSGLKCKTPYKGEDESPSEAMIIPHRTYRVLLCHGIFNYNLLSNGSSHWRTSAYPSQRGFLKDNQ